MGEPYWASEKGRQLVMHVWCGMLIGYPEKKTLAALGQAKYFSNLELASDYWQVPVTKKNVFISTMGLFEFLCMLSGPYQSLCNLSASDGIIPERTDFRILLIYLDNIIFSVTFS